MWEEMDKVGDVTADISFHQDCLLVSVVMSEEEFKKPFAIHRSILREGILV